VDVYIAVTVSCEARVAAAARAAAPAAVYAATLACARGARA